MRKSPVPESYPDIEELVPHSGEMLLLDRVLQWDGQVLQCAAAIRRDNVFVSDGEVPAMVTIEHMAQTCAAFMGLRALENNEPVRLGYLLGCRTLDLHTDVVRPGEYLTIEVELVGAMQTMASFDCRVSRSGDVIAAGVINVMYADTPAHHAEHEGPQ